MLLTGAITCEEETERGTARDRQPERGWLGLDMVPQQVRIYRNGLLTWCMGYAQKTELMISILLPVRPDKEVGKQRLLGCILSHSDRPAFSPPPTVVWDYSTVGRLLQHSTSSPNCRVACAHQVSQVRVWRIPLSSEGMQISVIVGWSGITFKSGCQLPLISYFPWE